MLPKERALSAIAHRATDRAPANYSAHGEVNERLLAELGLADYEELLQFLGVDFRRIDISYWQPKTGPDADGYMRDMWGDRYHTSLPSTDPAHHRPPFTEETTIEEVQAHQWPSPDAVDYSRVKAQCAQYAGTYATFGAPWSPFFHEVGWAIGQENLFMWMHTKPEVVQAIIDGVVDYEVEVTRRFLDACDGLLDITYFGNDFGTQRGLFISPEQWLQFFRAPLKRFYDISHDYGCKVMQHSCGAIRAIIPWLIEDGVDILDPVQVRATDMALDGLVADFGDRLAFHGGVDTQQTLPFGNTADVRAQVRAYLDLTAGHGGYILSGSQEYIADIPNQNILAIYEENQR